MTFNAKVLADSIANNVRLTTFEITFPRIILAEANTHRILSKNSASSRAIPVKKRVAAVQKNPFVPLAFGKNKSGMQANEDLAGDEDAAARKIWQKIVNSAIEAANSLADIGVHKQLANRITEFASWHTVIITGTEWDNFFNLRAHPDAQPEIQTIARMMKKAMNESDPIRKFEGEQHLPLIFEEDINAALELCRIKFGDANPSFVDEVLFKISCGRCARVSYLTHDGRRDIDADIGLAEKLQIAGHLSPFEHAAIVADDEEILEHAFHKWNKETKTFDPVFIGNFRVPWLQYRKMIPGEDVFRR